VGAQSTEGNLVSCQGEKLSTIGCALQVGVNPFNHRLATKTTQQGLAPWNY